MKHRFIKMTLLSLAMSLSLIGNAQQIFGKWVIPTESYGTRFTNELTFTENGIEINDQLTPPAYSPVEFSAGGYSPNYDLSFYVLGETFWDGSAPFDWVTTQSPYLQPEFQIINMPGEPNKYYSFFTGDNISDRSTDFHFCYNEIEMVDGTAQLSDKILLRGGLENYISFAITKPDNGEQKLFVCSGRNSNPVYPDYLAGIRMWTITNNSITGGELVISEEDQLLDQWDFDAYNMEYTFYLENNEKKDVMAWIHGIDNPSYQQDVTELIVVNDGIAQKFFLNSGRLAGIEFSTFETGVIYVSSAIGLLKVNYNTGQVVEVLSNNNYQATYLQTAPDGHIYGVSNSGDNLCQINMTTGVFSANYYPFPINHQVSSQKLLTGTTPYYILPENERVFIPLEETVDVEPESCPDMYDGEVWITVTGGAPFSPPDEPYLISSDPVLSFTWDEDNNWFHAENLTEGTYEYTITDAAENVIEGEFVIIVDFTDYTYMEHQIFDGSTPVPGVGEVVSFAKGFTIPKGANITFNNCTILMGPDAKIIIEYGQVEEGSTPGINGGILQLNHTIITNHARCNDRWEGIEVRGLPNQSQLPGANGLIYQGQLVVLNQSEINNAWNAVATKQDGVYGKHGGIIKAENSYFRNNKRSVEILPYDNFNPYGADVRMRYNSWFKNCTFEWNDNYILPMDMNTHVGIWNVWYIDFYGCKFQNNTTNEVNTGYGIYSEDGGCRFINYCSSTLQPCPENETERCEFKNLFTGIYASNTSFSNNRVYVNDADFENNSVGVYLSKVNYAAVLASRFHIGDNPQTKSHCADNSYGFGIDAHACMGFAFEDNTFDKAQAATTGFYTGIRVSDCPSEADVIYHNNFVGLSYGNYAYGTNRAPNTGDKTGVIYQCNHNTNNAVDFIVTHDLYPDIAMIHTHQGIPNLLASGNTFSDITGDNDWNFRNEGKQNINWYFCDVCPDETPVKYFPPYDPNELPLFTPIPEPDNTCPSHYGGGIIKLTSSQKQQKETEFAVSLSNYNNVKALYDNLKDGGNSTGELLDVQTATPDDMWALRSQLLGHSPHLSEEVLKEVADRTDVFPETAIFDILAANPDELDMEMLHYLEEKEVPLPDYLLSILHQVAGGTTYKTVLLQDMAYYHVEKTKAAQDIIRSILADTVVDQTDYRNWLDNMGGLEADKQIIESYLSGNDIPSASLLLNILPGIYELEDEQLVAYQEYTDLINLQINLMNENRTILDLTTQEQSNLLAITESADPQNRATAKNILKFAYGYEEYECQYISDPTTMKAKEFGTNDMGNAFGMSISVTPNPAATWAQFEYTLPRNATDGSIIITDITGKWIETIVLQSNQGSKLWDTRKLPKGVYLYTLKSVGLSETGKVVISR